VETLPSFINERTDLLMQREEPGCYVIFVYDLRFQCPFRGLYGNMNTLLVRPRGLAFPGGQTELVNHWVETDVGSAKQSLKFSLKWTLYWHPTLDVTFPPMQFILWWVVISKRFQLMATQLPLTQCVLLHVQTLSALFHIFLDIFACLSVNQKKQHIHSFAYL
jgi:hypothetical protein